MFHGHGTYIFDPTKFYLNLENDGRLKQESSQKQPSDVSKIGVLKNFVIFTGKQQYWSLFLIKLQESGPATLLKK